MQNLHDDYSCDRADHCLCTCFSKYIIAGVTLGGVKE